MPRSQGTTGVRPASITAHVARVGRDTSSTIGYRGDALTGTSTVSYAQNSTKSELPVTASTAKREDLLGPSYGAEVSQAPAPREGSTEADERKRVQIAVQERRVQQLPTKSHTRCSRSENDSPAHKQIAATRRTHQDRGGHAENSQPNKTRPKLTTAKDEADDRVVRLARELWAMDQKQMQVAKGVAQLRATGTAGKATEEVAKAAEEAMERLIAFEQRGDVRAQAKAAAERDRRKRVEEEREQEAEHREMRLNTKTNEAASRMEKMRTRQQDRDLRTDELLSRKRDAEIQRRRRDVEVLVDKEVRGAESRVHSARERELLRRDASREQQERDHQREQHKDALRRQHEVWRREDERHRREGRDPQMVRSRQVQDLTQPYALRSQVAPYALQQQPMRNVLSRWRHPD